MSTFYFTYSNDGTYYFNGGWTEIEAHDEDAARQLFKIIHPNPNPDNVCIWCAGIYNEEYFLTTDMYRDGNYGHKAWERYTLVGKNCDTGFTTKSKLLDEILLDNMGETRRKTREDEFDNILSAFCRIAEHNEWYELEGDEEWEALYDKMAEYFDNSRPAEFAEAVFRDGYNMSCIREMVDEIIENRSQVYRIPVHIEQTFDIYVRAKNYDAAIDYIRDMGSYELEDYYSADDMEFELDPYTEGEVVEEWEADTIIEADE